MSRTVFSFSSNDISALARSLTKQWGDTSTPPSHLQMLNMLARAAGYQNFQHFRAEAEAQQQRTANVADIIPFPADSTETSERNVRRLMRHFDEQGRLMRWPTKFSEQQPCLWPIWARIPARRELTEREVNDAIKLGEAFGDHVLIRRELVNYRMLERTIDGRIYKRREQAIPAESALLVREALLRAKAAA